MPLGTVLDALKSTLYNGETVTFISCVFSHMQKRESLSYYVTWEFSCLNSCPGELRLWLGTAGTAGPKWPLQPPDSSQQEAEAAPASLGWGMHRFPRVLEQWLKNNVYIVSQFWSHSLGDGRALSGCWCWLGVLNLP